MSRINNAKRNIKSIICGYPELHEIKLLPMEGLFCVHITMKTAEPENVLCTVTALLDISEIPTLVEYINNASWLALRVSGESDS